MATVVKCSFDLFFNVYSVCLFICRSEHIQVLSKRMYAQRGLRRNTDLSSKVRNDVSFESEAVVTRLSVGSFKGNKVSQPFQHLPIICCFAEKKVHLCKGLLRS